MRVFLVDWERTAVEREMAAEAAGAAMLVGCGAELTLLMDRWAQSKDGRGQVVLLSGEACIGKSRLVETLRTHVMRDGATHTTFRSACRCSWRK